MIYPDRYKNMNRNKKTPVRLALCVVALFLTTRAPAQSPSPFQIADALLYPSANWPRLPSDGEIEAAFSRIQPQTYNVNGQDLSALAPKYGELKWQKMHTLQPRRNHVIATYMQTYMATYNSTAQSWHCMALGYADGQYRFIPVGMRNFQTREARDQWVSQYNPGWLSDTSAPESSNGESQVPDWVLVVGGSAALGAAVTAVVKSLKKRKKSDDPEKPEQKKSKDYAYILQLSADRIVLEPGKPAALIIQAWKVDADGRRTQATNASLAVSSGDPAVLTSPSRGFGNMQCSIAVQGNPKTQIVKLMVTGAAEGKQMAAEVQVQSALEYRLEIL
jgi:hypothetical protein